MRHVGEHVARVLAESFPSIEALEKASLDELTSIREIGPKVAESIYKFFRQKQNQKVIEDLLASGVRFAQPRRKGAKLEGKVFVFTGALQDFKRSEAKKIVEDLGGRVASSVSKKVDYVVVGEDPGSKLEEAKRLGIQTIDEATFKKIIS